MVVPAALIHELFNYPKGHPQSHLSGEVFRRHAADVLQQHGYPAHLIDPISQMYSCARILSRAHAHDHRGQGFADADRLDAIRAIRYRSLLRHLPRWPCRFINLKIRFAASAA